MYKKYFGILAGCLLIACAKPAEKVNLPALFGDNMVLQQKSYTQQELDDDYDGMRYAEYLRQRKELKKMGVEWKCERNLHSANVI